MTLRANLLAYLGLNLHLNLRISLRMNFEGLSAAGQAPPSVLLQQVKDRARARAAVRHAANLAVAHLAASRAAAARRR
jgi:hypothetical protein